MDSEIVTFQAISEDYSKLIFMQCDRYIEIHNAPGRYYRLRIPKYGRDLQYHYPTCDLFLAGVSSEIYRLNLERGQFLLPFSSSATEINKLAINPVYQVLVCGTKEGKVEAWDPRSRERIGILDCGLDIVGETPANELPSVTALNFQNGLTMGVGTATGHILLYDIRANKPFYVKDHMYGFPIKNIEFENSQDLVLSMDRKVLKIWEKNNGKIFTSIQAKSDFNDLCFVKNTGMIFIANESPKIMSYYIPSLGPAPKWCGFLDSLTEELEENKELTIYDDYKFVTKTELKDLGLSHLVGTKLLRAYMHGYFIDIRLYKKAKALTDPFAFEKYKKKKIREKIEEERVNRVKIQKLPDVNKDLALRLMTDNKKKSALLEDNRFQKLFENPDFQIDKESEEYRFLNPVLSKFDKMKKKDKDKLEEQFAQVEEEKEEELEGKNSSEESSSDDDDVEFREEMKKQFQLIKQDRKTKEKEERKRERAERWKEKHEKKSDPKFYELKEGVDYKGIKNLKRKTNSRSLGERLAKEENGKTFMRNNRNCREMQFTFKTSSNKFKGSKGSKFKKTKRKY